MKRDRSSQGSPPLELDEHQLSKVVGGYLSDGQDLSEFHPLAWPIIRIADLGQVANPGTVVQKIGVAKVG